MTIVADRPSHLVRLVRAAMRTDRPPDEIVVVDMGSELAPSEVLAGVVDDVHVVHASVTARPGELPLAAARNQGAASATGDQLVFLDVDCLPGAGTFGAYERAIDRGGLVCGPVRYLERFWEVGLGPEPDDRLLAARSSPHPTRPTPDIEQVDNAHELFWSLSFGLDRSTWAAIGGFDEAFVGYGAEDTDFAFTARARGVPLRWLPDGVAFHQWHRSEAPPVGHLRSIVSNARAFRHKWHRWPMEGWLREFARRGLVTWEPDGERLDLVGGAVVGPQPLRLLSIPASHPYARRVVPPEVEAEPDPTEPWWPHRAFDLDWLAPRLADVDVVHVHFGFDHLSPDEVGRWTELLGAARVPLVVTVHDLHSPHDRDPGPHLDRLRRLLGAAGAILTLTDDAARALAEMGYPDVAVVPHPHVAPREPVVRAARTRASRVGLHLKGGRANLLELRSVLEPLASVADDTGCLVDLRVDEHAPPDLRTALTHQAAGVGLTAHSGPRLDDAELLRYVDGLDVSVLPYAFGTHSGWSELCRDRGVRVVAPAVGSYGAQWDGVELFGVHEGRADAQSLDAALREALRRPPLDPSAEHHRRTAELEEIHSVHRRVYRSLTGRSTT